MSRCARSPRSAVREDRDDGDNPGELALALAVYNDDFTRSFVSESAILTIEDSDEGTPVGPGDLPAGASLCTTVADTSLRHHSGPGRR